MSADARPAGPAPVFLVGASRSGTTLLRLMLNEHPDVAIPSESHFLGPLLQEFGPDATLDGASLEHAIETVTGFAQWRDDFRQTETELRNAVGNGPVPLADFIDRIFRLEVGADVARWGDKTPPYLRWVDKLLACFPNAQAIAIVRDPRDVYTSLAELEWFGTSTWEVCRYLQQCGDFLARWRTELPPGRFTVVRYEDLVLDTEQTLRMVCAFLDLPFVAAMHEFFAHADEHVPEREIRGHHTKLRRAPSPDDVERWRTGNSRRVNVEVEALTAPVVDAYGYDRRVANALVPLLRVEARVRYHARDPLALVRRTNEKLRGRRAQPTGATARQR